MASTFYFTCKLAAVLAGYAFFAMHDISQHWLPSMGIRKMISPENTQLIE